MHQSCFPPGQLGLWAISEPESWLRDQLILLGEEQKQLDAIKGEGRRKEFLAARLLLHKLSKRPVRAALIKDRHGKPRLADSRYQISISHTNGLSAAFAHPKPCGVDVQRLVQKIHRIAPKFINKQESGYLSVQDDGDLLIEQHLIWSAKEAMYKAYGLKQLDFKAHLTVILPELKKSSGPFVGTLKKAELTIQYDFQYWIIDKDTVLVVCVERERPANV
ncbi:MAG: 4'-phosphopantetheinyl transferase superfamily protein [Bacteroidota bacterium]